MCGAVAGPFPPGPSLPGSGWQEYSSQLKRREPGRRSARFTGRPVSRDEGGNGGDPYPARARGRRPGRTRDPGHPRPGGF